MERNHGRWSGKMLQMRNKAREKAVLVAMLGIVIRGMDFTKRDLLKMGFSTMTVYRAIKTLENSGFVVKATSKGYALTESGKAIIQKFARQDISQFSYPSIHDFLFTAYEMGEWDDEKMKRFLRNLESDWKLRIRRTQKISP